MSGTVTLTDIKITKKGRYALFCGEEFLFSVDEETFASFHLHKGIELTEQEITSLRKHSDYNKALDRAFTYLGIRDHSEHELYSKLCRNFDEVTSAAAVDRIRELGYIDDQKFASMYAEELAGKGKSLNEIRSRLSSKYISRDIVDQTVSALDIDERNAIAELVQQKYIRRLTQENGVQKVYAALIRKGYRSADILSVLKELTAEEALYDQD